MRSKTVLPALMMSLLAIGCAPRTPPAPVPPQTIIITTPKVTDSDDPDQQANAVVQKQIGPNYHLYVPMEIKSDHPEVLHSWNHNAYPGNGDQLAQAGEACGTDADCAAPYACFNRADSGKIPILQCALPPGH